MSTWFRRAFAVLLACTVVAGPALAVDESDLLPVDQAFALDASAPTRDGIALRWRIADGYYLYRHRISVQADPAFHAGALDLPRGASHHDEFFGDVETYRTQLQATLPGAPGRPTRVTLKVKYQGCADLGVCYPPQTRRLTVALPAATASGAGDAGFPALGQSLASGQRRLLGAPNAGMDAQPLPPEQAFGFEAIVDDGNTLLLRFTPAQGYYLYRDKTSLRISGADGISRGTAALAARRQAPRRTLRRRHRLFRPGRRTAAAAQAQCRRRGRHPVRRRSRAARTGGICYPLMTRRVALRLPAVKAIDAAPAAKTAESRIRRRMKHRSATHIAPATAASVDRSAPA